MNQILKYLHKKIMWLYKIGILEYPHFDFDCAYGGLKPDTKVIHKKYGVGIILDYAEYHKIDKDYVHEVFFDSIYKEFQQFKREYGESPPLYLLTRKILRSQLQVVS